MMLMSLMHDLGRDKVRYYQELGDAMIYHARNKLAKYFLEFTKCEWSLWFDDDMIAPIGRAGWYKFIGNLPSQFPDDFAGVNTVERLLSHGKTVVGGTYFGRQRTGRLVSSAFAVHHIDRAARTFQPGLFEVDWIGTGCLLVHRSVFEDIQKAFPELGPTNGFDYNEPVIQWADSVGNLYAAPGPDLLPQIVDYRPAHAPARDHWDFFLPKPGQGEDVSFCERARLSGHKVYLDTGVQCLHVGYNCWGSHNTGEAAPK